MSVEKAQLLAMVAMAFDARSKAYAPYSKFTVGAAVRGGSGKTYAGCNVENASYGLTVCAERAAIFNAVSHGEETIEVLAVAGGGADIPVPCGACLQVLAEFAPKGSTVTIAAASAEMEYDVFTLEDCLPMPFTLEVTDEK